MGLFNRLIKRKHARSLFSLSRREYQLVAPQQQHNALECEELKLEMASLSDDEDCTVSALPVSPLCPSLVLLSAEPVNEGAARDFLTKRSWPHGLQNALLKGLKKIPMRYFICDDSGSMTTMDGMRFESFEDKQM